MASIELPDGVNAAAFNKLLDENLLAGTRVAFWCIKSHLMRFYSMAFHKWVRYTDAMRLRDQLLLMGTNGRNNSISMKRSKDNFADDVNQAIVDGKRNLLLSIARDIISGSTLSSSSLSMLNGSNLADLSLNYRSIITESKSEAPRENAKEIKAKVPFVSEDFQTIQQPKSETQSKRDTSNLKSSKPAQDSRQPPQERGRSRELRPVKEKQSAQPADNGMFYRSKSAPTRSQPSPEFGMKHSYAAHVAKNKHAKAPKQRIIRRHSVHYERIQLMKKMKEYADSLSSKSQAQNGRQSPDVLAERARSVSPALSKASTDSKHSRGNESESPVRRRSTVYDYVHSSGYGVHAVIVNTPQAKQQDINIADILADRARPTSPMVDRSVSPKPVDAPARRRSTLYDHIPSTGYAVRRSSITGVQEGSDSERKPERIEETKPITENKIKEVVKVAPHIASIVSGQPNNQSISPSTPGIKKPEGMDRAQWLLMQSNSKTIQKKAKKEDRGWH